MNDQLPPSNVINLESQANKMPESRKTTKFRKLSISLLGLIIYSAILITATYYITSAKNEANLKSVLSAFNNSNNPLFLNLSGTTNGKIVDIKGDKAWINTDKGGKLILSIKEPVTVSEISNGKLTELGTTIDKIKLNEHAAIRVSGYGSGYIITAVTYINDSVPNLIPGETASVSAKPTTEPKR